VSAVLDDKRGIGISLLSVRSLVLMRTGTHPPQEEVSFPSTPSKGVGFQELLEMKRGETDVEEFYPRGG